MLCPLIGLKGAPSNILFIFLLLHTILLLFFLALQHNTYICLAYNVILVPKVLHVCILSSLHFNLNFSSMFSTGRSSHQGTTTPQGHPSSQEQHMTKKWTLNASSQPDIMILSSIFFLYSPLFEVRSSCKLKLTIIHCYNQLICPNNTNFHANMFYSNIHYHCNCQPVSSHIYDQEMLIYRKSIKIMSQFSA